MSGNNNDEIVIGANGSVFVAPVGTTAPTGVADTLDTAFVDLGFLNENGVKFRDGKTIQDIPVWQSFYPARRTVTARESAVIFAMRQWNRETLPFAFGGHIVSLGGGEHKLVPPDPSDLDDRALVVDWADGSKNYRLYIARGNVADAVETDLVRSNAADLPITFGVLGEANVAPWLIFTDDPSFAAAGS